MYFCIPIATIYLNQKYYNIIKLFSDHVRYSCYCFSNFHCIFTQLFFTFNNKVVSAEKNTFAYILGLKTSTQILLFANN